MENQTKESIKLVTACPPLMKALARNTALKSNPSAVSGVIGTLIIMQAICTLTIHSINANALSSHVINNCITRAKRGDRSACKVSLSTLRHTMECPTNRSSLEERKRELKCEFEAQNCTEPTDFQYHCLLNEYANHLVEVCAIATKIVGGVCGEFNEGGAFIQEHYTTRVPCSKCPFVYVSTDAYKWHMAGVTGQQGILIPPRHLIPYPISPMIRVCHVLNFVIFIGYMGFIKVRHFRKKTNNTFEYLFSNVLTMTRDNQECYKHIQHNFSTSSSPTIVEEPEMEDTLPRTSTTRSMTIQNKNQEKFPIWIPVVVGIVTIAILLVAVRFIRRKVSCNTAEQHTEVEQERVNMI